MELSTMEWLITFLGWLNPIDLIKRYLKQKKTSKKLRIYKALEQTGPTPPSLTVEQISEATGLSAEEMEPLLYEMIQEGTVKEGPVPKAFTRYLRNFSRSPYK
jgi:hypothetical protein